MTGLCIPCVNSWDCNEENEMIRKRSVLTEKRCKGIPPKSHRYHHPERYTSTVFVLKRQWYLTQAERSHVCRHWIWPLSPFIHVHLFSVFVCISQSFSPAASLLVFWESFVSNCFQGCIVCDSKEVWWNSSVNFKYNRLQLRSHDDHTHTHTHFIHTSVYMNLSFFLSKALARLRKWSLSLRCISCCAAVWCVFIFWLIYLTAAICIWGGEKCVFVCTWVRIIIPFNFYDFLFVNTCTSVHFALKLPKPRF